MAFEWNADKINKMVDDWNTKAVTKAVITLRDRVREMISVPAPRVRLFDLQSGSFYYVAGFLKPSDAFGKRQGKPTSGFTIKKNKKTGALEYFRVPYIPSPAEPGAPPRKLSGTLRARQFFEVEKVGAEIIGRVGTNVKYARPLEFSQHYFYQRALQQFRYEIEGILGRTDFGTGMT